MTGYISKKLKQTATYWAPSGQSGYGEQVYSVPVIIKCRWQDSQELVLSKNGELEMSKAIVYTKEEIDLNGYLALGDFTLESDPSNVSRAFEVKKVEVNVSVDGKVYFRKVYL